MCKPRFLLNLHSTAKKHNHDRCFIHKYSISIKPPAKYQAFSSLTVFWKAYKCVFCFRARDELQSHQLSQYDFALNAIKTVYQLQENSDLVLRCTGQPLIFNYLEEWMIWTDIISIIIISLCYDIYQYSHNKKLVVIQLSQMFFTSVILFLEE